MASKKIYSGLDMKSPFHAETFATLPPWQVTDERRLIYVENVDRYYLGTAEGWFEISFSKFQSGESAPGQWIYIPGIWRSQPNIRVWPSVFPTFNSEGIGSQIIRCYVDPADIEEWAGEGTGQWRFKATLALTSAGGRQTFVVNQDVSGATTATSPNFTPPNTTYMINVKWRSFHNTTDIALAACSYVQKNGSLLQYLWQQNPSYYNCVGYIHDVYVPSVSGWNITTLNFNTPLNGADYLNLVAHATGCQWGGTDSSRIWVAEYECFTNALTTVTITEAMISWIANGE